MRRSATATAAAVPVASAPACRRDWAPFLLLPPSLVPPLQLALVLLALLLVSAQTSVEKDYSGWLVVRAQPSSAAQLRHLDEMMQRLGEAGAGQLWRRRPTADVLVRPDVADWVLRFLGSNSIPARVHVADVGEEIRRERSTDDLRRGPTPPDMLRKYLRYDEINAYLENLERRYSNVVSLKTFAQSYEGRGMKVIEISTAEEGQNRPVVLIDAGIHAREWIAPSMALYIIQQLVENASNADLIANVDWHIIPLLNPDGYEYSHTTDRMWRKTRSWTDDPNCYGADPNRNFDFYWGVVGVSWEPCKETYAGAEPFSEVEAEALALYGMLLRGRLRLYVSIHSYGGVQLGSQVASAIRAAGVPRFDVGNCYETLGELAAGGSDDWMKGVAGANFSFTLEMPAPSFTTPAADIRRYVVPTFEGFRTMGRYVDRVFG